MPGGSEAAPPAVEGAVLLDLLEKALQLDLGGALDAEGLGDLALSDALLRLGDEGEDLLACGEGRRSGGLGRRGGDTSCQTKVPDGSRKTEPARGPRTEASVLSS